MDDLKFTVCNIQVLFYMQFHSDYNYFVRYIPGVGWNSHYKNTLISNSYSGSSKRIGEKSSGSRLTVPSAWWWNQEKELASLAGLVIVVEYLFFTGNRYSFVLLNIFDLAFYVGNADHLLTPESVKWTSVATIFYNSLFQIL